MAISVRVNLSVFTNLFHYRPNSIAISKNTYVSWTHTFKMKSKKIRNKNDQIINSITPLNQHEILADIVTPYWQIPYEEELQIKQDMSENIINQVFDRLKNKPEIRKVVNEIIASPVRDAYRNKDEFSVWHGIDGNPKTIGFYVGSPAVGKVVCVPPTHLKCIKTSHKEIAQLYQEYIQSSPLRACHQLFDKGFWRNIVIRSNESNDHLATVITHPADLVPEQIEEQQQLLKEYFTRHVPSLSLFHQSCTHVKCTREQAPIHHLSGQPYLVETLSKYQFRISSDSFFQVNKHAAELMYQTVLDMARPTHYTTLLDLYCGTGTISLHASAFVRGCIGIEEVQSAVEDAKYNAEMNNITNCKFVQGRVELKLQRILKDLEYTSDIVAVVNPGRNGAGEGVISLLRQNPNIIRIIYLSCKPDNSLTRKNFIQLCERVNSNSKPFTLTKVVPVDVFPYTLHCELVLCFEKT